MEKMNPNQALKKISPLAPYSSFFNSHPSPSLSPPFSLISSSSASTSAVSAAIIPANPSTLIANLACSSDVLPSPSSVAPPIFSSRVVGRSTPRQSQSQSHSHSRFGGKRNHFPSSLPRISGSGSASAAASVTNSVRSNSNGSNNESAATVVHHHHHHHYYQTPQTHQPHQPHLALGSATHFLAPPPPLPYDASIYNMCSTPAISALLSTKQVPIAQPLPFHASIYAQRPNQQTAQAHPQLQSQTSKPINAYSLSQEEADEETLLRRPMSLSQLPTRATAMAIPLTPLNSAVASLPALPPLPSLFTEITDSSPCPSPAPSPATSLLTDQLPLATSYTYEPLFSPALQLLAEPASSTPASNHLMPSDTNACAGKQDLLPSAPVLATAIDASLGPVLAAAIPSESYVGKEVPAHSLLAQDDLDMEPLFPFESNAATAMSLNDPTEKSDRASVGPSPPKQHSSLPVPLPSPEIFCGSHQYRESQSLSSPVNPPSPLFSDSNSVHSRAATTPGRTDDDMAFFFTALDTNPPQPYKARNPTNSIQTAKESHPILSFPASFASKPHLNVGNYSNGANITTASVARPTVYHPPQPLPFRASIYSNPNSPPPAAAPALVVARPITVTSGTASTRRALVVESDDDDESLEDDFDLNVEDSIDYSTTRASCSIPDSTPFEVSKNCVASVSMASTTLRRPSQFDSQSKSQSARPTSNRRSAALVVDTDKSAKKSGRKESADVKDEIEPGSPSTSVTSSSFSSLAKANRKRKARTRTSSSVLALREFVKTFISEKSHLLINKDLNAISELLRTEYERMQKQPTPSNSDSISNKETEMQTDIGLEDYVKEENLTGAGTEISSNSNCNSNSKRPNKFCRTFIQKIARGMGFILTKNYGLVHESLKRCMKIRKRGEAVFKKKRFLVNDTEGHIEKIKEVLAASKTAPNSLNNPIKQETIELNTINPQSNPPDLGAD